MYEYYSPLRPLGFWIQKDVKGKFRLENKKLFTEEEQNEGFIKNYELKQITKITDEFGNIIIEKFYDSYNIDKSKLSKMGISDRDVFSTIINIGIVNTAKEIKEMLK